MHFLYNIGIHLYGFILFLISFFNPKAKLWINGRKDFFNKLPEINSNNLYWFHCASLGEYDQAIPVINAFKEKDPSIFILVTFFSPSGYEHYKKRNCKIDYACYLPLDTKRNAFLFIKHFNPSNIFFVKYEFWANYIFEAKKNNIKLFSISSIFRKDQNYFKKGATFFPSILKQFDYFFVQNSSSLELLKSISIKNCIVTGDTRFDRVIENKNNIIKNEKIELFKDNKEVVVIGSSWPIDESILIPIINENTMKFKFIIVPHNISENHIFEITKKLTLPFIRYSKIENNDQLLHVNVLILDTIGHLTNAYSYGDISYIGGGFSGKLHNVLEPAVFGLPVIFGPKYNRFPEAEFFIKNKIAISISNKEEIKNAIHYFDKNKAELKHQIIHLIEKQRGAANRIVDFINAELL
jgi:3-deoxy-D-manno-octulosonic-acid transferase